ncbi:hypothetical protein [Nocardia huaxiensis]|uniref:hypothetical protein n=1 Tax=Nocardia huaxiensis TaxID=2755382 RepID=UPI001E349300|nr:hypothetical protein [Nocardia huaxiensis]UFS97122.1 hypothetical protein LPY97_04090 [Nocardia huaxiensis]
MPDNDFGYTAWGKDWVRLAEPLKVTRPDPLLPRARRIARLGEVRLEIDGVHVRASIHYGAKASVTYLELTPLPAATVQAIAEVIPADALTLADELHTALRAAGITVAPVLANVDCSCSARTPRCIHLLVTCYTLALRVDETPWLALDLQGYRLPRTGEEQPAGVPAPRWTPLSTLDPMTFFEMPAG